MSFTHHNMHFDVPDEWWDEAGMVGFIPSTNAYATDFNHFPDCKVRVIAIQDVSPVLRNLSAGIFTDDEEASARERVGRILRGFKSGAAIPPVEIVNANPGDEYAYKLVNGAHRFYCSLAAGYTHVPTVIGFDISTLNQ